MKPYHLYIFLFFSALFSNDANALVAGYEFDFSKAKYIILGQIVKCNTLKDDLSVIDLYEIKLLEIIMEGKVPESNSFEFPPIKDSSFNFIYARHESWIDTGYNAMVGSREKLIIGKTYIIPMIFDDKLGLYTVFDMYYKIKLSDDLLEQYIKNSK